jgi:hypothetical protein
MYIVYIHFVPQTKHYTSPFCGQEVWPLDHRDGARFSTKYINPGFTLQVTQYISVLQPVSLTTKPQTLSTIFYITYINIVRTSQETYHISVLQPGTLTTRPQKRSGRFLFVDMIVELKQFPETIIQDSRMENPACLQTLAQIPKHSSGSAHFKDEISGHCRVSENRAPLWRHRQFCETVEIIYIRNTTDCLRRFRLTLAL